MVQRATSSAYRENLTAGSLIFSIRSFIMIRKSVGEITLPCGRPWSWLNVGEWVLPHLTWKVLSFKKFLIKFAIRPLMPALWIFISSAVLFTLSNAFLRSKNTASVCFLAWNPLCIESII